MRSHDCALQWTSLRERYFEDSEWDPQFGQHERLVDNSSDVTALFILASAPVALTGTGSRSEMKRAAFGATAWRRANEELKFG